jgi:hypothetical protein
MASHRGGTSFLPIHNLAQDPEHPPLSLHDSESDHQSAQHGLAGSFGALFAMSTTPNVGSPIRGAPMQYLVRSIGGPITGARSQQQGSLLASLHGQQRSAAGNEWTRAHGNGGARAVSTHMEATETPSGQRLQNDHGGLPSLSSGLQPAASDQGRLWPPSPPFQTILQTSAAAPPMQQLQASDLMNEPTNSIRGWLGPPQRSNSFSSRHSLEVGPFGLAVPAETSGSASVRGGGIAALLQQHKLQQMAVTGSQENFAPRRASQTSHLREPLLPAHTEAAVDDGGRSHPSTPTVVGDPTAEAVAVASAVADHQLLMPANAEQRLTDKGGQAADGGFGHDAGPLKAAVFGLINTAVGVPSLIAYAAIVFKVSTLRLSQKSVILLESAD